MSSEGTSARYQTPPSFSSSMMEAVQKFEFKIQEAIRQLPAIFNEEQIENLKKHKYDHGGTTLLDPYMQKYWDWFVEFFPLWMAPNLLTIIGLTLHVSASIFLMILTNGAKEPCTRWMYFLTALGLFLYQSLDAIDGKQARRTKSASPLGELFDHGCDSVSTVFIIVACCCSLQLGVHPWLMFWSCMCSYLAFYCAHWQTYVSGKLRFGKLDCTEAEIAFIIVHLITAISPSFWSYTIPAINVELRTIAGLLILGSSSWSAANNIYITLSSGIFEKRTPSGTNILVPFWPLCFFVLLALAAAVCSKTHALNSHTSLFLVCYGFIFSKMTNRLIVAHMSKSPFSIWDSIFIGAIAFCINQSFNCCIGEHIFLWGCLIFNLYDLLHYDTKIAIIRIHGDHTA
ncbi:unnamed protein product [Adineta ricciae]|uniref:diacylglycerol cholinephosphotransferase n=1 Tax=Adineta ricciae TaxID=249248 RepID=A0A815F8J9_ADIRI|nr:unnamed protein product [Adineta ricciae]